MGSMKSYWISYTKKQRNYVLFVDKVSHHNTSLYADPSKGILFKKNKNYQNILTDEVSHHITVIQKEHI